MKMITYYFLIFFFLSTALLYAQQEVNYTMYRYHLNLINPAVTGTNEVFFANFSLRTQWVGIKDAPETQALSAGVPNKTARLGTGFSIINDRTFVENQTQVFADFSYHLPLGEENDLFLGLKAGGTSVRLHADGLQTYGTDQTDQYLTNQSSFVPNIGVGIYLKRNNYYLSLSIPRLLSTERFRYDDGQVSRATDRPHFFGSTGSRVSLNDDWSFLPSVFFSYVSAAPVDYMINTAFAFQGAFELGALYTKGGGIGGTTFFNLNNGFQLGYSYVTSSVDQVTRFSKGTHEIILKFSLEDADPEVPKGSFIDEQISGRNNEQRLFKINKAPKPKK